MSSAGIPKSTTSATTAARAQSGSCAICAAAIRKPYNPSSDFGTCPPAPSPAKSLSPTPTLKRSRSRSTSTTTMDPDHLSPPPPPQIDGEAMLEIFVHKSIRFTGMPMNSDSPYGDGPRLAAIGSKMLEACYMTVLFNKRPMLKAEDLDVSHRSSMSWFPPLTACYCRRPSSDSSPTSSRSGWMDISGEKRCATQRT